MNRRELLRNATAMVTASPLASLGESQTRPQAEPNTLRFFPGFKASLEYDKADLNHKIECPMLSLWGERAPMGRLYDVLSIWKERAKKVSGKGLPGGHNLQEDVPDEVYAELRAFLKG